ncbi:MAG: DciA family protein [Planctomycetota bacterium]|jgi:predicted nucleic acid-binding Zn ribbon protein
MKDAKPLGEILANYMRASGLGRRSSSKGAGAAWPLVAGETTARHSRVAGSKKGVLFVTVDSAACLQELANFRKAEILASLRNHEGCAHIHDIKFKLGALE